MSLTVLENKVPGRSTTPSLTERVRDDSETKSSNRVDGIALIFNSDACNSSSLNKRWNTRGDRVRMGFLSISRILSDGRREKRPAWRDVILFWKREIISRDLRSSKTPSGSEVIELVERYRETSLTRPLKASGAIEQIILLRSELS